MSLEYRYFCNKLFSLHPKPHIMQVAGINIFLDAENYVAMELTADLKKLLDSNPATFSKVNAADIRKQSIVTTPTEAQPQVSHVANLLPAATASNFDPDAPDALLETPVTKVRRGRKASS